MRKLKSFSIFTFSNFMYSFSQWVIIILIIKFIDLETVGEYSLGLAVSSPLVLLTTFGANILLITSRRFSVSEYFSNKLLVQSILYISIFIILYLGFQDNIESMLLIMLVILLRFSNSFIDLYFASEIAKKNHTLVSKYKLTLSTCYIFINFSFISLYESIVIPTIISILLNLLLLIIIVIPRISVKFINLLQNFKIIKLGIPISLTLFLSSLNSNIPKYALEILTNSFYLGVFTSLLFFYSVGNQVFFSINSFLMPYIKEYKNNKEVMTKFFRWILLLPLLFMLFLIISMYVFLDQIIILFFNEELLEFKQEMMMILIFSVLIYYSILFDIFINIYEKYKFNTLVQFISVILVTFTSFILIHQFGLDGAIYSFIVYCLIVFVLKLFFTIKILRRGNNNV